MRVHEEIVIEGTDLTTGAISSVFQLEHILGYSVSILYTGSSSQMTTKVTLEVTNNDEDWFEYYVFELTGTSDSCLINATDVFYKAARFKLEPEQGSISPTFTVYKKGM